MSSAAPRPPRSGRTPTSAQAGRPVPFRQRGKREREERLRRLVIFGVVGVLALTLLIPLIGYYREVLTKGTQPVAWVGGEKIALERFAKLYGYRTDELERRIMQLQQIASQMTGAGGANPFQQQLQRLQSQRASLDAVVLNELVENRLVAREAAQRGIEVTEADVDAFIREQFGDPPQPTPEATASPPAEGQPTPAPTIDPMERFRNRLANMGILTEAEYRDLVARPALLRQRLEKTFLDEVPTAEPQARVRHILVDTEEAAREAKQRIASGEPFEKVAAELSKDSSNKEQGGDLGWVSRGQMVKPFEDAVFSLPVGQVSDPVQTNFGWHIIEVLERDENRPLEPGRREQLAEQRLQEWLQEQISQGLEQDTIEYDLSEDEVAWARRHLADLQGQSRRS